MRAYVKTSMKFYAVRLLCISRHAYAFVLGGPRIELHRIFQILTAYMRFMRFVCCLSYGVMLVYAALLCLELGKEVGQIRENVGETPSMKVVAGKSAGGSDGRGPLPSAIDSREGGGFGSAFPRWFEISYGGWLEFLLWVGRLTLGR